MLSIAIIWDKHIIEGERPIALSKRDGQKLRLVPRNEKILSSIPYLNAAFKTDHHFLEACSILEKLTPGKSPNRAELAWARSLVYLKAGNAAQALRASSVFNPNTVTTCTVLSWCFTYRYRYLTVTHKMIDLVSMLSYAGCSIRHGLQP